MSSMTWIDEVYGEADVRTLTLADAADRKSNSTAANKLVEEGDPNDCHPRRRVQVRITA